MRRMVVALVWVVGLLGIGAAPAGAIVNGGLDGSLHPEVGTLVGDIPAFGADDIPFCSGTLISQTVVVTAAHCDLDPSGGTFRGVSFASRYAAGSPLLTGKLYADPNFNKSQSDPADVAVVVLDKAVKSVTPARLPSLGALDRMFADGSLNQSTLFTSVGYGDYAGVPDAQKPPTRTTATAATQWGRSTR